MTALDALLADFEARLLPHERFFIGQGLSTRRWHREKNLPPDIVPCAYLDAEAHNARADAHLAAELDFASLRRLSQGWPLSQTAFGGLVQWAVVELRHACVANFCAFALLVQRLAGREALHYAPALYAAATLHPAQSRGLQLSPQAITDMTALLAAFVA